MVVAAVMVRRAGHCAGVLADRAAGGKGAALGDAMEEPQMTRLNLS